MTKPKCNCGSMYEDENGIIHYAECDVVQYQLGLYITTSED